MLRQLGLKLVQTVLVVLAVSLVVFVMNYFGGDPVYMMLPPQATAADIAAMRRSMGLDQPLVVQYGLYMLNLARGQLGSSWTQARPVLGLILERLPATLEVAGCGMLLALAIGIPSGLVAATAPRSWFAKATGIVSILGISIPPFWLGISLILTFAVDLGWLPSSGRGTTVSLLGIPVSFLTLDGLKHLVLPSLTSALFNTCLTMRLQYAATREELTAEYVRYALARGVSGRRIVAVHAFPNTLIPMITFSAMVFAQSIAFSVVTETIFAWPGVGKLLIDAIGLNDRPLITGYLIFIAVLFSVINLSADLTYAVIDPRVRLGARPRSR
jgi:peptide/nickel transport system permease protein